MSGFNYATHFHIDSGTFVSGDGAPVVGSNGRLIHESFTGASDFVISGGTFVAGSREGVGSGGVDRTYEQPFGAGGYYFSGKDLSSNGNDNNASGTRCMESYSAHTSPYTNLGGHREINQHLYPEERTTPMTSSISFFTDAKDAHIFDGTFTIAKQPALESRFVPFSGIGYSIGGTEIPSRKSCNILAHHPHLEEAGHSQYPIYSHAGVTGYTETSGLISIGASSRDAQYNCNMPPYPYEVLEPRDPMSQHVYWPTFSSRLQIAHPESPMEINKGAEKQTAYTIISGNSKRQSRLKALKHKKKFLSLKLIR